MKNRQREIVRSRARLAVLDAILPRLDSRAKRTAERARKATDIARKAEERRHKNTEEAGGLRGWIQALESGAKCMGVEDFTANEAEKSGEGK